MGVEIVHSENKFTLLSCVNGVMPIKENSEKYSFLTKSVYLYIALVVLFHSKLMQNSTLTCILMPCSHLKPFEHPNLHYYTRIDPKHLDLECTWVFCCLLLYGVKTTGGGLVSKAGNHSPPSNIVAVISAFICLEVARSFETADLRFIGNACRGSVWLLRGELKKCDLTDER